MLTFELDNGHYSVTPPEGIVLYAGKEATGAHSAMLDYHACRDSDLEIIQSTGGISLVEGFMPAVLARQFQETATDEFEIESEAEGFACVSGWIPTHKARALAAVMRLLHSALRNALRELEGAFGRPLFSGALSFRSPSPCRPRP